eukprot:gene25237-30479_t
MGESKEGGDSKQPAGSSPRRRRLPKGETSISGLSNAPRESRNQPTRRPRAENGGTEPPTNAVVADPVTGPETAARGQKKEGQDGKKPRRKWNKKAKKVPKNTQPQDRKVEDVEAIAGGMEKLSLNPDEDGEKNEEAASGPSGAPPNSAAALDTTALGQKKKGQGGKKPQRKRNTKATKGPKRTQPQDRKVEDVETIAGPPRFTATPEMTARSKKEGQDGRKPRSKRNETDKKVSKSEQPRDRKVEDVYEKKKNEETGISERRRRKTELTIEQKEALKEVQRRLREERREAAAARLDTYFAGQSHLQIIQDMCRKLLNLSEDDLPRSVREGKRLLEDIYLNIFDYVDHAGHVPAELVFNNIDDLIDRCEALRKGRHPGSSGHKVGYYPADLAKEEGLKDLLRSLFFGRRRRG